MNSNKNINIDLELTESLKLYIKEKFELEFFSTFLLRYKFLLFIYKKKNLKMTDEMLEKVFFMKTFLDDPMFYKDIYALSNKLLFDEKELLKNILFSCHPELFGRPEQMVEEPEPEEGSYIDEYGIEHIYNVWKKPLFGFNHNRCLTAEEMERDMARAQRNIDRWKVLYKDHLGKQFDQYGIDKILYMLVNFEVKRRNYALVIEVIDRKEKERIRLDFFKVRRRALRAERLFPLIINRKEEIKKYVMDCFWNKIKKA